MALYRTTDALLHTQDDVDLCKALLCYSYYSISIHIICKTQKNNGPFSPPPSRLLIDALLPQIESPLPTYSSIFYCTT